MESNQYLAMFIDESIEHLQTVNENFMQLENSPSDISIVQNIFRSAHTLKGMSATMGFEDLANLTHEMENVLDLVRNEQLAMNDHIFDVLFTSFDALEAMVNDIIDGGDGKADVQAIVQQLTAILKGDYAAAQAAPAVEAVQAGGAGLDQYQLSIIEQSLQSGFQVFNIHVVIREDCLLKAVRAYMVFDVLERNGEVAYSNPTVQDIEQEKFERSFTVYYITKHNEQQVKQLIMEVSEIESAEVQVIDAAVIESWKTASQQGDQQAQPATS